MPICLATAQNPGSSSRWPVAGAQFASRAAADASEAQQATKSATHPEWVLGPASRPTAQKEREGKRRHQNDSTLGSGSALSLPVVIADLPLQLAMLQGPRAWLRHRAALAQLRPCCRAQAARSSYSGGALAAIGKAGPLSADRPQGVLS